VTIDACNYWGLIAPVRHPNAIVNLSGLSCITQDNFCGLAHSSGSKKSQKDDSDSDSGDEVRDELSASCTKNLFPNLFVTQVT
jgi:hypothetical protein